MRRAVSRFAPNQWEMTIQRVSLAGRLESALYASVNRGIISSYACRQAITWINADRWRIANFINSNRHLSEVWIKIQ